MTVDVKRRAVPTILVVEDDPDVARAMKDGLDALGYAVRVAETGAEAKALLASARPDLIILDLILPDIDGLVLCAALKAAAQAPIVICTATTRSREAVLALKLGADDFIRKPCDLYELEARIEAVLRRSNNAAHTVEIASIPSTGIQVGDLLVDPARRTITIRGEPLGLTPTEYRLLSALASHAGEVLPRNELAEIVWGHQMLGASRTIDVHVTRLRAKLASARVGGPLIITERRIGYRMATGSAD
jgi:DNA-binding response OmpR family regulator